MGAAEVGTTIDAEGWRFNPWGMRLIISVATSVAMVLMLLLLGPPVNPTDWLEYAVVLAILGCVLVDSELGTVRSIILTEDGVIFRFPRSSRVVSWDTLAEAPIRPGSIERMYAFIERLPDVKRPRYYRVTYSQALSIRERLAEEGTRSLT